jgi:hypothetical protein
MIAWLSLVAVLASSSDDREARSMELARLLLPASVRTAYAREAARKIVETPAFATLKPKPRVEEVAAILEANLTHEELLGWMAEFLKSELNAEELDAVIAHQKLPIARRMRELFPKAQREIVAALRAESTTSAEPPPAAAMSIAESVLSREMYRETLDQIFKDSADPAARAAFEKRHPHASILETVARFVARELKPEELAPAAAWAKSPLPARASALAVRGAPFLEAKMQPKLRAGHEQLLRHFGILQTPAGFTCPKGQRPEELHTALIGRVDRGCLDDKGKKQGKWTRNDKGRAVSDHHYVDDILDGPSVLYAANGGRSEQTWKKGFLDGPWTEYDELGHRIFTENYRDGRLVSVTQYDASGERPGALLDKRGIAAIIRRSNPEARRCYEAELDKNPNLSGRVVLKLTITPMGTVSMVNVSETTLNDAAVEKCLVGVLRKALFPTPGEKMIVVNYPFVFSAQ